LFLLILLFLNRLQKEQTEIAKGVLLYSNLRIINLGQICSMGHR